MSDSSEISESESLPEPSESSPPFAKLDPRVIHLWRLQHLISSFVLLMVVLIGGGIAAFEYRPVLPWVVGGWLALAVVRVVLLFWYPARAYAGWGYRVDAQVLETMHGVWFRTITLLPLSRLQHVDLNRGPLERMIGLASVTLYTAGTHHATVEIPGLEAAEAARLRDYLVALGSARANHVN